MPVYSTIGLVVACFFWAVSFIATKVAVGAAPPLTVVTLRLLVSAICFALWFFLQGRSWGFWGYRRLRQLFLLSLFGTGLHYGLQTIGLQFTAASNASIYAVTGPISITLIAAVFLGERISLRKGIGIVVAIIGVLWVMGIETLRSFELKGNVLGDMLVFASIAMWGMFTVYGKKLMGEMGAFEVIAMTTIIGSVWMVPIGWAEMHYRGFSLSSVTPEAWAAIGFLGVTCSFLATLLYFMALQRTESQKVGIYMYTIPPMTYAVAALYLGEKIGFNLVFGSILVLAGVYLTERG